MDISIPASTTVDSSMKILHFIMGEIDFAIRLSDVNEIVKMMDVRKIPRVPPFIEGVLHLRGDLIIVVSLRKLLNIEAELPKKPKIIIFSLYGKKIGFIVDDVVKILLKQDKQILPPPPVVLEGFATDCITGVFEEKNRNILMMDLKRSLAAMEEEGLNKVLERELTFLIDQINE